MLPSTDSNQSSCVVHDNNTQLKFWQVKIENTVKHIRLYNKPFWVKKQTSSGFV